MEEKSAEKKSAEKKNAEKNSVEKNSVEKTGVEKKRKYGDAISASDLEKNNPMYSDDTFLNFLSWYWIKSINHLI